MKTWKPIVAGVVCIITGVFTTQYRIVGIWSNHWGVVGSSIAAAIGIIAIVGGIFMVMRQRWWLALAGAVCTVYPAHPWGDLIWTPVLGVLAIVLLWLSRNEFSGSRDARADGQRSWP